MICYRECEFNPSLECRKYGTDCSTCGWNPEVKKRRLEEMSKGQPKPEKLKYISLDDALAVARYSKDPVAGLESLPFILK